MLLIAAFAIYVIITKRLRITRSITVTGKKAREFGIALLVITIPLAASISALLRTILPALPMELRVWPWPSVFSVVLFSATILAMAFYLRDQPEETAPLATGSEPPPN